MKRHGSELSDRARRWLGDSVDEETLAEMERTLEAHAGRPSPVVTLFGAYDTGKSALLRRLLVDEGEPVPEWLSISAMHETFDVHETAVHGCVVRDAPGIIPADDVRAAWHSDEALAACRVTDVLVLVLTPQLVTGERDLVRQVLGWGWAAPCIAAVVNRFDEAGSSPEDDLDGYRQQQLQKSAELRRSLEIPARAAIFAVASDPYQVAGSDRQPDSEIWDAFRGWDKVDEFASWMRALPAQLAALREEATDRFWRVLLAEAIDNTVQAHGETATALDESRRAAERLRLHRQRLDAVTTAALADLIGRLDKVTMDLAKSGAADSDAVGASLQRSLDNWFDLHCLELDAVDDELDHDLERQRSRPGFSPPTLVESHDEPRGPRFLVPGRERVERYGGVVVKALQAYKDADAQMKDALAKARRGTRPARSAASSATSSTSGQQTSPTRTSAAASRAARVHGILTAVLPAAYELVGLLNEEQARKHEAAKSRARREHLRREIRRAAEQSSAEYRAVWDVEVDRSYRQADEVFGGMAAQLEPLEAELVRLEAQIDTGRSLLAELGVQGRDGRADVSP